MHLFSQASVTTDDIAAPFLLEREMAEQAACANGLVDHDNLSDEVLTVAKVATGVWNDINRSRTTTAVSINGAASTATDTWTDVPKESSTDPLKITIQTQDSALQIETSGRFRNDNIVDDTRVIFAVAVDGAREVLGGDQGSASHSSWHISALVPVGPGEHTVSVQYAFVDVAGTGTVGLAWIRLFGARQLWVREVKR
jgi:hypothetical protein